jgi:hypothetical protein
LSNAKAANPYSLQAELKLYEEVISLEGGLAYAERVLEERF